MNRSRITAFAAACCVVFVLFISGATRAADYAPVYAKLDAGDVQGAQEALSRILGDSYLDVEALLLQSTVEPKGDLSLEFLQKCLLLCKDEECGTVPARLAEAYYAAGRYEDVIELYKDFHKDVDYDRQNLNLHWFAGLSYLELSEYSDAEKAFKEIDKKYSKSRLDAWGNLGLASVKYARDKHADARAILGDLVASGGALSALAIYNGAYIEAKDGLRESALHGYEILSSEYGDFIGSTQLADAILQTGTGDDAGRFVDITYSIEAGTFSDKAEAQTVTSKLKAAQWTARMQDKLVGDRKYWVVYVGVYRSQQSALNDMEHLKSAIPGSYRVVAR